MSSALDPQTGRLALAALIKKRSPLGALEVLYARAGRFFQVPLPSFHPYIVGGADWARKILTSEREKVRWRNADPVTDLLRRGVLVTDGEEHDRYRQAMEPPLHPARLGEYAAMMTAQTDRVAAQWKDGQTVDMLVESRKIALLIVMQALFSADVWTDLPVIWTPILKAIEYISPGAWIFWRKIPRPGYKKHLDALDAYLYALIRRRRAAQDSPNDLLRHLMDAGLDDALLRDQMLTMLIAGHDTSTALLAWTFYLLGTHPEIHRRLVRELDQSEARPPLLDAVIKESLRLYPPIHLGNRIAAEELSLNGERIPAGARLFYSIYLTHRDSASWQAPDEFRPERFEQGEKRPPFSYIPFGGGPRACIGAAFGQAEARSVLTRLLKTFSFELVRSKVRVHMGATLEPRPGVFMKVRRR